MKPTAAITPIEQSRQLESFVVALTSNKCGRNDADEERPCARGLVDKSFNVSNVLDLCGLVSG